MITEDKNTVSDVINGNQQKNVYNYTSKELNQFQGLYYCEDLNKIYKIKVVGNILVLKIDEDDLKLVTKDKLKFSYQEIMVLSFDANTEHDIGGFNLNVGEDVRGLKFVKLR
jgi:hypothetical protein